MYCLLLIICMWLVFWIIIEEKTFNGVYVWENRDFAVYSHFVVNGKEEKYMHCFACVQKVFKSWILRFWVVCMRLSRRTSHYPAHYAFPSYHLHSFPSYYSSGFRSVWNFVCFLLFRLYSYSCRSSSVPIFSLLRTTFFLPGIIYLLFLKLGLRCCNAPYTTQFWELY